MVARLDFGLLRPLDLSPAIQAFQNARQMRMQEDAQKQQGAMMQQRIDAAAADADRERLTGDAVAQWFESQAGDDAPATAAPATAPMQPAPATGPAMAPTAATAPTQPEMGAMPGDEPMQTVTAAPDRPNPMRFLADIARNGGPQGAQLAMQLFDRSRTISKEEREQTVGAYDAMAAATASLASVPYEQRKAALVNMAPALVARGIPANMIESFDPTDEALTVARNQALGIKGVLEVEERAVDNARDDARLAETRRANAAQEAQGAQRIGLQAQGNAINAAGVSKGSRRAEADLRKEFNALPEIKEWREIGNSYRQIYGQIGGAKANSATAQNDIAAVFSYMKMLDPGSVVREGEFANAQNAAGIPDQVRNLYNRAVSGNRLNPQQRNAMLASAAEVVRSRQGRVEGVANQFRSYAADYGVEPNRVAQFDRVIPPRADAGRRAGSAPSSGWGPLKKAGQ